MDGILEDIAEERRSQNRKWGKQRHGFAVWLTILAEEVGELSKEILNHRWWKREAMEEYAQCRAGREVEASHLKLMRLEAVQVAAVAVAMIEHIDELLYPEPEDEHEEGSEPEYPDGMLLTFDDDGGCVA